MQVSGRVTRVAGLVMEAVGLKTAGRQRLHRPHCPTVRNWRPKWSASRRPAFPHAQSDVEGIVPGAASSGGSDSHPARPGTGQPPAPPAGATAPRHLPVATPCSAACSTAVAGRSTASARCTPPPPHRLSNRAPNPLSRAPIADILDVGVRAINSMLTVGRGQRMGLFAGSGVGKSVLLGMMRATPAPTSSWSA